MCMVVYIASEAPLTRISWDDEAPAFHVADIPASHESALERLTLPHKAYIGSHEHCGCGFQLREHEFAWELTEDELEGEAETKRSLAALADYLDAHLAAGHPIQVFAAWNGGDGKPPEHSRVIRTVDLRGERFFFLDGELSTVECG